MHKKDGDDGDDDDDVDDLDGNDQGRDAQAHACGVATTHCQGLSSPFQDIKNFTT